MIESVGHTKVHLALIYLSIRTVGKVWNQINRVRHLGFVHDLASNSFGAGQHVDPLNSLHTGIVPLTEVVCLLNLIPIFDTAFSNIPLSSNTCMEGYAHYYLNMFADKDMYLPCIVLTIAVVPCMDLPVLQ